MCAVSHNNLQAAGSAARTAEGVVRTDVMVDASLWTMLGFASLQFALAYVESMSGNAIPAFVGQFTNSETLIYLIVSLNPFFNIFVQPYVGWKSDRIWTPLGRRKPFIVVGAPFLILFLILTPYAEGMRAGLFMAFLFILFYQFFQDVVFGAYVPLFGDIFTARQRGMASGIHQMSASLGHFFCLALGIGILTGKSSSIPIWLASWLPEPMKHLGSTLPLFMTGWKGAFLLGAVLMAVCVMTVLTVREKPPVVAPEKTTFHAGQYYREIFANRQWVMLYLAMLFLTLVPTFILGGYMRFAQNSLHMDAAQAAGIWSLWPLIQLVLAWPVGILADKIRRRTIIYISLCLGIVASLCGLFAASVASIYVFTVLFGVAIAVQRVGFLPIIADYVPPDKVGTVMGGVTQLRGISNFMALPIMGLIIDSCKPGLGLHAFRIPFVLSALTAVVALCCLRALGQSAYTDRA